MNTLIVPVVRVVLGTGRRQTLTIPGIFAALLRDEVESFPALRPHQRHAWHAFLVQVGALALHGAGMKDPPQEEEAWAALLRGLTPDYPDDEPWSLVALPHRPALLQPPLPSGNLGELKNLVATPDALDMLVTSKNHDLKAEVMVEAGPDDWLFALVTLQTMEGFLGAGNYGISRMNGGFANRPALGIVPPGGLGDHVRRDISRLLALRDGLAEAHGFAMSGGLGLLWLKPWDGATSLRSSELDPYYVEICRRVRLVDTNGRLSARAGGSKAQRVVPIPGGVTGDPWAPTVAEKDGTRKVFTADASGFGYRRMVRLMFRQDGVSMSPLQIIVPDDADVGLVLLARALTRGQGKTEGLHERRVMMSKRVKRGMAGTRDADRFAGAARDRVTIAGELQNRVLKPALLALFENGPDKIDYKDDGADRRASSFLRRFDEHVDETFFPRLWDEFEDGADQHAIRAAWVAGLVAFARALIEDADRGASKALKRRYRARARADGIFSGALNRNTTINPYLPEPSRDHAA